MVRHQFDDWDRKFGGRKGGLSVSPVKIRAARRNGRKGGRPRAHLTLLERILKRRLAPAEYHIFQEKVARWILLHEQQILEEFFHVVVIWDRDTFVQMPKHIPPHIRQRMRVVKALCHIYMPKRKDGKQ